MKRTTPATELVEACGILHSIFVPNAEIARRMHVDQATVDHIVAYGCVPQHQMELLWTDEPAASYEHPTR